MDEADYRQHRDDAYRLVYARLRDRAASEDVVQDSFLRVLRYRGGAIGSLGALVRTIAINLIRDHARSKNRRAEDALRDDFEIASDASSPEEVLLHRERVRMIAKIVDDMPPLRRDVFLRRRLHGESARHVAAALSISPAAVDAHVARAILTLHKAMAEIERIEDAA